MNHAQETVGTRNERLAVIVERCLESPAAYRLFSLLASISELDADSKIQYLALVRESEAYTAEEIEAIERLILSGTAQYLKEAIDQVREERIQREIDELLALAV